MAAFICSGTKAARCRLAEARARRPQPHHPTSQYYSDFCTKKMPIISDHLLSKQPSNLRSLLLQTDQYNLDAKSTNFYLFECVYIDDSTTSVTIRG